MVAAALMFVFPMATQAAEGIYLGGQAGVNFAEIHQKEISLFNGYNIGMALGHAWCNGVRLEAEVTTRCNNFHGHTKERRQWYRVHGHARTLSLMSNAYYNVPTCTCFTPYLGAGVGGVISYAKVHHRKKIGQGSCFAWQGMAGVNYDLWHNWELTLEYKYQHCNNHLHDQSITLGAKMFFGCGWEDSFCCW